MASNVSGWMDFAQRSRDDGGLGLAPHQAAGLVGNLQNESGSDLSPWGVTGDNGTAWGTAQWRNERLQGLKQHAQENGLDYRTPEAQQAWMRREFDTTHNGAYKSLLASTTPEEAANVVNRQYEISADRSGHREASARRLFDGSDGPTAIDQAMGRKPSTGSTSMMAYADTPDEGTPALRPQQAPGALQGAPQQNWLQTLGQTLRDMAPGIAQDPDHARALQAGADATRKVADNGTWSVINLPDGTPVRVHNKTGVVLGLNGMPVTGDHSKEDQWVHYGKDAYGPRTGYDAWKKSQEEGATPQQIPMWGNRAVLATPDGNATTPAQHDAYLASMQPGQAELVRGLLENRIPLTAQAMSKKDSPYPAAFAAAAQIDPTIDPTAYLGRQAGQRDWATKGASSARALNQTIAHQSEALVDAMKGLNNGSSPLVNDAKNMWNEKIGGHDAVPVFRTAAHAVVDELGKVFKQNNLSDAEIKSWEANLPANMSPEQQRGQIRVFRKLMDGAMGALEDQRKQAIGGWAAAKQPSLLSDEGRSGLKKLEDFAGPATNSSAAPKPATGTYKDVPWSFK